MKLGKVLISKHNIGIALIDLTKMDKLGSNIRIYLDDYKVMLWQPTWLDMVLNVDIPDDEEPDHNPEEMLDPEIIEKDQK